MNTSEKAWALGLSAIFVHSHGGDTGTLGGFAREDFESDSASVRRDWLRQLWDITNTDDVREVLGDLFHRGASYDYHRLLTAPPGGPDEATKRRLRVVEETASRTAGRRLLAWDAGRLAAVASMAVVAGYLGEDEAWDSLLAMGRRVRAAYGGWREFGEHYLIGRQFWSDGDASAIRKTVSALLRPRGAWRGPWLEAVPGTPLFVEPEPPPTLPGEVPPLPLPILLQQLEGDLLVLLDRGLVTARSTGLRPPASEAQLEPLTRIFGPVPEAVLQLLRWHDGQSLGPAEPDELMPLSRGTWLPLNGVAEMLAVGVRQATPEGARHLPLFGGRTPTETVLGLALDGDAPGSLRYVHPVHGCGPIEAPSLDAWVAEAARLRRGTVDDLAALHPGDVPVTPSQAFKLALSANLTLQNGGSHTVLTTLHPIVGAKPYLDMLSRWWSIRTRAALLRTVEGLLERAQEGGGRVAYDAGRVVFLARAGACVRMLDSREAWQLISRAAAIVHAAFNNWQAYSDSYIEGLTANFAVPDLPPEELRGPARAAWDSSRTVQSEALQTARALLSEGGLWYTLPWPAVIHDDGPPLPPALRRIHVSADLGSGGELAQRVRHARPGDVLEIDEGVHGAVAPAVSIAIVARWGTNRQDVHLVGDPADPALRLGDCGVLLRKLMISCQEGDGVVLPHGAVLLDRCLVNTPRGIGIDAQSCFATVRLDDCHVGGLGLSLGGSCAGIERTSFGQTGADPSVRVSAGKVTLEECEIQGGVLANGDEVVLELRDCTLSLPGAHALSVEGGARASLAETRFDGGGVSLNVAGGTVVGSDLEMASWHRGAIRALDGSTVRLSNVEIGEVADAEEGATAILVQRARLQVKDLRLASGEAPALRATRGATVMLFGESLESQGDVVSVEDGARCTLVGVTLRGGSPARTADAWLGLLDCTLEGERVAHPPVITLKPRADGSAVLDLDSDSRWMQIVVDLALEGQVQADFGTGQVTLRALDGGDLRVLLEDAAAGACPESSSAAQPVLRVEGPHAKAWAIRCRVEAETAPTFWVSNGAFLGLLSSEVRGNGTLTREGGGWAEVRNSTLEGEAFTAEGGISFRGAEAGPTDRRTPNLSVSTFYGVNGKRCSTVELEGGVDFEGWTTLSRKLGALGHFHRIELLDEPASEPPTVLVVPTRADAEAAIAAVRWCDEGEFWDELATLFPFGSAQA